MALLADLISLVHFAYVAYVVLGQVLILVGLIARWAWVRNFWFRATHLGAIAIVALEAVFGITCPLTTWEHQLRRAAGQTVTERSFVADLVHQLMFFELPEWSFRVMHISFAVLPLLMPTCLAGSAARPKDRQ